VDQQYQDMHKRIEGLRFRFQDSVDDHSNPMANKMQEEIHGIMEDMQSGRDPHHIADRVRGVRDHLHEMRSQGTTLMSSEDLDSFYHNFEHMHEELKRFPHY
jgi:hypothetical protein